jgi:sigma-B regulation protein RsbU (phosphoserine phosphatase)
MARRSRAGEFFDLYTSGLNSRDLERMFTRDAPDAYRYFARGMDLDAIAGEPWYRRGPIHARRFFTAFTMKLSPARRVLFAFSFLAFVIGMVSLFRGFGMHEVVLFPLQFRMPLPEWVDGALALALAFVGANLLILMEVADRLSLKSDLEIARDIQQAMLPNGVQQAGDAVVFGLTRPANTVGGDFYDILPREDGRVVIALGDVAGKGSPAALLMALLLAMLRTLVDEGLDGARLIARLNAQVARHSPASRFITFFYALYDPGNGQLTYVNAGHLPGLIRRTSGQIDRIGGVGDGGGLALGMFDHAEYEARTATLAPGDLLLLYSDGITEAETRAGRPFEESGLEAVLAAEADAAPEPLCRAIFLAVEAHADQAKLADDLTTLVLKRQRPVQSFHREDHEGREG